MRWFAICRFIAVACLACALCIGGCGKQKQRDEPAPAPPISTAGGEAFSAIPGVGETAAAVKTPSELVSWRAGTQLDPALTSPRVSNWDQVSALYSPGGATFEDLAFGLYSFKLDTLGTAAFKVKWHWESGSAGESGIYLGLANFEANRWDWHTVDADNYISLANLHRYTNADDLCLAVVLVMGNRPVIIRNVGFASGELYDEVEPNSSPEQAQLLPAAPVYAFSGSLGRSHAFSRGYDGSNTDYFELSASDGDVLTIMLDLGDLNFSALERVELSNNSGELFGEQMGWPPVVYIRGITYQSSLAPYLLKVSAHYTEYDLYIIEGASGDAPVARLDVAPKSGPAPLLVSLNASASSDPNPGGTLTRFEWDFEGDGIWDFDSGADPTAQHTYTTDGVFSPRVRVGNNLGLGDQDASYYGSAGQRTVTVGASPYDEVEDNDGQTATDYNTLPSIPFSGYMGNVGYFSQEAGPVYDGDWTDYFTFQAEAGLPYSFLDDNFIESYMGYVTGDNPHFGIFTLDNEYLGAVNGYSKSLTFVPDESGTYILRVSAGSNKAGRIYSLRAINSYPPQFYQISASAVNGVTPLTVDLTVNATDPDSTELSYAWGEGTYPDPELGTASTTTLILTQIGTHYIYAFVTDETGLRTIRSRAFHVWPYDYDEVEPNDASYQANELPALPVQGFLGSLSGLNNGGYDGSYIDRFRLSSALAVGKTLTVSISYSPSDVDFDVELQAADGSFVKSNSAVAGQAQLQHTVLSSDAQPFRLKLEDNLNEANANYTLNVSSN